MSTDKIETKELCIIDDQGKTRIALTVQDGDPAIKVLDSSGNLRIDAGIFTNNQVGIFINDEDGTHRAALHVQSGGSHLQLFDKHGNIRIDLTIQDDDERNIGFVAVSQGREKGGKRAMFVIDENGTPQLRTIE